MKANETAASRIDRVATLARERRQEEQDGVQQEQQQLLANNEQQGGAMADVANNQAHLFHRNLANMGVGELLENLQDDLSQDEDQNEPSNFQAWYVRSANNSQSRSRERSAIRQEQEQELSEPDQDMEETLEGDQSEEAAVGYERFERHLFRSLSLDPEGAVGGGGVSGSLASFPSNHNPFLNEPGGNGNLGAAGGAVSRRNSGFV